MRILINMDHCRFVEIPAPATICGRPGRLAGIGDPALCQSVLPCVIPFIRQADVCVGKMQQRQGFFQTGGDPVCLQIYFLILCYRGRIICGRCGIFPLPLSAARRSQVPDHPSVPDETVRPGPFFPLPFPWLRYCRQRLWL